MWLVLSLFLLSHPIHSESLLDKIKNNVISLINENIKGKITAQKVSYTFPNQIDIEGMEVLDENNEKVIVAKQLSAQISLGYLLLGNIVIKKAQISEPIFNYKITNDRHNVVNLFQPKNQKKNKDGKKIKISIENITIKNATFLMQHDHDINIKANEIDAEGKFSLDTAGPFLINANSISIKQGIIQIQDVFFPLSNLKASDLEVSNENLSIQSLNSLYENAKVSAHGGINIKNKQYSINAKLEVPQNMFPKGIKKPSELILPAFFADVYIDGYLEDPHFHAKIHHEKFLFNDFLIENGDITSLITKDFINISQMSLNLKEKSLISGQANIDIGDIKNNVKVDASLKTKDLKLKELNLPGSTKIKTVFNLKPNGVLEFSKLALQKKDVLDIFVDGLYYPNGNADINIKGQVHNPENYILAIKNIGDFTDVNVDGKIKILGANRTVEGSFRSGSLKIKNFKGTNAEAKIYLHNNILNLTDIRASLYRGELLGEVKINGLSENGIINSNLLIKKAHIEDILIGNKNNIEGKLNLKANIFGQLKKPEINFSGEIKNGRLEKMAVNNALFSGNMLNDEVRLQEAAISSDGFSIILDDFLYNLKNENINYQGKVLALDLSKVFEIYSLDLKGNLQGHFNGGGSLKNPHLKANLIADAIKWQNFLLGGGEVLLNIDEVLSLALNLINDDAPNKVRLAYNIKEKILNLKSRLNGVTLSFVLDKPENLFSISGDIKGDIVAQGPIDNLKAKIDLTLPKFSFSHPSAIMMEDEPALEVGPLFLNASLEKGYLDFNLCANINDLSFEKLCDKNMPLTLSLEGPFSFNNFSLNLSSHLNVENWAHILPILNNELISINSKFVIEGKIDKKNTNFDYNIDLEANTLEGSLPGFSYASLVKPAKVNLKPDEITIIDDIVLDFWPGELRALGNYKKGQLDLKLSGSIPLILARPWAPLLQRAEGLAKGHLDIFGSTANPLFDGELKFSPGSLLLMKKYLEPITIKGGTVFFKKQSEQSFTCKIDRLELDVGEGQASLDGLLIKDLLNKDDSLRFELSLNGHHVLFKNNNEFIEADFKLKSYFDELEGQSIFGFIDINSGSFFRPFDLRNFVAESKRPVQGPSFDALGIHSKLNINLKLNQLEASARMLNIYIDTVFQGELKLGGFLSKPKVKGNLFLSKGSISFPSVNIDLDPSNIELNELSNVPFDPILNLVGTTVLNKHSFIGLSEDTTIELKLTGDLNKIDLSLKPISGDISKTRLELFLMLLSPRFGKPGTGGLVKAAQGAALTVFLRPLTSEIIENILAEKTKSKIQFGSALEPGGFSLKLNWKIGQRLALEGNYLSINEEKQQTNLNDNYMSDLKLILYLFDHRPLGPLALETILRTRREEGKISPSGEFRLKYTIVGE